MIVRSAVFFYAPDGRALHQAVDDIENRFHDKQNQYRYQNIPDQDAQRIVRDHIIAVEIIGCGGFAAIDSVIFLNMSGLNVKITVHLNSTHCTDD